MAREKDLDLVEDEAPDDELEEIVEAEGAISIVGFLSGLVLGALAGAGIALLLAPERGDVTRRRIRRKFRDVSTDAREQFDDWKDDAGRELKRRQRQVRKRLERN
ncbi:MAG: YtxH domain-containing protein [Gemmatimonadales bacterium]|jgi:gas vesicle protein|nr:YtxH domain-containing protein [Gemmatimonadales bacterium]